MPNAAPVANADFATVNKNTGFPINSVTINVVANDTDADGDALELCNITFPAHGSIEFASLTSIKYTPDFGFQGTDSFMYTVYETTTAEGLESQWATVTITVTGGNSAPIAGGNDAETLEDTPVTIEVLNNDFDLDNNPLTVSQITQGPAHGSVVINPDNTVTYTPATGFSGTDTFKYTCSDGMANSNEAPVIVTVDAVNQPPAAANDSASTNEDTAVTVNVLDNDSDVDGNPLTVTDKTDGTHGTVVINANHTLTYTPALNYNGSDSFTYTISDGQGGFATATVNVSITPVNDDPVALDDSLTFDEDNAATINVLGNDSDVDGDSLTVTGKTDGAHGTVVINANNTVTYTPALNYNGSDSFSYTISDGHGGTATANVSLTINPVNDDPVAVADSKTTDEDTPATINVLGNDSDVDGDSLSVLSVTQGAHGSVANNGNGTVTYTPDANYNGSDSFSYTVSDGNGGFATANVSVTINPVNDAPAITSGDLNLSATTINEAGSVTLSGSFADPDAGQAHTVVINWGDGSGNTTISLGAGVTSFGPQSHTYGDNGLFGISVSVTDSQGGNGSASKNLTVNNVAPTAAVSGPSVAIPGQTRTFSFSATDPSAVDTLAGFTFTVNWGDGSSQTVSDCSSLSLDHVYSSTGNFTVSVTATDKDGGVSAAATKSITVSAIALQQDPTDASKWAIFVGGTSAADTITFKAGSTAGQVIAQMVSGGTTTIGTWTASGSGATFTVTVNGVQTVNTSVASPASLGRVVAYGNLGDDSISVVKNGNKMLAVSAYFFGDSGNDSLDAGGSSGNNVLVGGIGVDKLSGGSGRDILIGGTGQDTLKAGNGGSIMIGESTDYDSNMAALTALLAEWGGGSSFNVRINHLSGQAGGLNGPYVLTNATVHSDGVSDDMTSATGQDWFFAKLTGGNADKIRKQDAGDVVTSL